MSTRQKILIALLFMIGSLVVAEGFQFRVALAGGLYYQDSDDSFGNTIYNSLQLWTQPFGVEIGYWFGGTWEPLSNLGPLPKSVCGCNFAGILYDFVFSKQFHLVGRLGCTNFLTLFFGGDWDFVSEYGGYFYLVPTWYLRDTGSLEIGVGLDFSLEGVIHPQIYLGVGLGIIPSSE